MFANQTIEKLEALGLHAMAAGLSEQLSAPGTYDEACPSPTGWACWSTKRPTPATAGASPPG